MSPVWARALPLRALSPAHFLSLGPRPGPEEREGTSTGDMWNRERRGRGPTKPEPPVDPQFCVLRKGSPRPEHARKRLSLLVPAAPREVTHGAAAWPRQAETEELFAVAKGPGRTRRGPDEREGRGSGDEGAAALGGVSPNRCASLNTRSRARPQSRGRGRGRSPGGEGANKQRAPRLADTHGFMSQKRGGTVCAVTGAGAENEPATRPDLLR